MSEIIESALKVMREDFGKNDVSILCRSTKKENPKGKCPKCGGFHGLPAIQLHYVGHAAITQRLLNADPSWTWEPLSTGNDGLPVLDRDGGLWIRLTVGGVTRLGYGDAGTKTGPDAMKERIGDALRNAAMRFGAALDLWHKGELSYPSYNGGGWDAAPDNVIKDGGEPPSPTPPVTPTPTAGLDESVIVDNLTAINEASDKDTLRTVYTAAKALAVSGSDLDAAKRFMAAKDSRLAAFGGNGQQSKH